MQNAIAHAKEAFKLLCRSVGSPYSIDLLNKAESEEWQSVYNAEMPNFREYHDARLAALDLCVYSYLRKYEGDQDIKALTAKAVSTFRAVEQQNRIKNFQIRHASLKCDVEGLILSAQRKIARLLGKFNFSEFLRHCEWGSGSTATIRMAAASVDNKLLERSLSVTPRCLKYARAYLEHDIHWMSARLGMQVEGPTCPLEGEFNVIEYGVFDTVNKDSRSRRTIDKQPTMNTFFQKALGKMLRHRLKRAGIDLNDQSRNKRLAQSAWQNELCTLDLANASNTVTFELVRLLFAQCEEWFTFLADTRTTHVRIEGKTERLELFSSMGNGFTFELETLVFWALSKAVQEEANEPTAVVSIYGDDIIVSRTIVHRLIAVLTECGFTINDQKSFVDGPFFESCGGQYFEGTDITPPYQKERVDSVTSATRAANRLLRWGARLQGGHFIDEVAHDAWAYYQVAHSIILDRLNRQRFTLLSRLQKSRKPKRLKPISALFQPFWLEGDGAMIDVNWIPISDRDGVFHIDQWMEVPVKTNGDHRALLAVSLRRSSVLGYLTPCELGIDFSGSSLEGSEFNGLVTIKGRTTKVIHRRRVYDDGSGITPLWACSQRKL